MKRALVLSLMILALGISATAASFGGSWDTDIAFDIDGTTDALTVLSLTSVFGVDYTIGDWMFGINSFIDMDQLFDVSFDVSGMLGAFSLHSFLDFDPSVPEFSDWESVVEVSIAGVDLYAAFALQTVSGAVGAGWAVGGHGIAGDVEVWVEADFNISSGLYWVYNYGYTLYDWDPYYSCVAGAWGNGFWSVQTNTCTAAFSNLDIIVEMPITCLDFAVWVNFDCLNGFDYIKFMLNDIDLGAGWFQLDDLDITFTADTKTVSTDLTLTLGSAVCVTPYFDLNQVGLNVIDGITLRALLLNYTYNGVTFKAGELFSSTYGSNGYYAGFTKSGSLSYYANCVVPYANEFVGIWFEGDSCCGGLTSANIAVFFDGIQGGEDTSTSAGIFDFILAVANVEVGIGSGFSIRGGLEVSDVGLEVLSAGFTFSF